MELIKKPFIWIGALLSYIQNHFKAMLFLLLLVFVFGSLEEDKLSSSNLAIIKIEGEITQIDVMLEAIDKAEKNEQINRF